MSTQKDNNKSQLVGFRASPNSLDNIDDDEKEGQWDDEESAVDSLSMQSEEEYILSTNDFTFMIINHAILKFEPMIAKFQ